MACWILYYPMKLLTLTGTGVAWANVNLQTDKIYWIQKWPGRKQAAENKVGGERREAFTC